ncbi:MAG: citrate/2-methylcitrate synthase, partial [Micromonosporaceae bacterium]
MGDPHRAASAASAGKGLADVVAASTEISDIDGQAGVLSYRGYDIHDLAGQVSFEECAYLLHRSELPNQEQLRQYASELHAGRDTGPTVEAVLATSVANRPPMEALRTLVSALSADDVDTSSNDGAANARKAARLVAQMPVLVAAYQARR